MRGNSKEPWYRKVKDTWYAWVNGSQVSLGVRGRGSRREATAALDKLLTPAPAPAPTYTVATMASEYLVDIAPRVATETIKAWTRHLKRFVAEYGDLAVSSLETLAVEQWASGYGNSPSSVFSLLAAVASCCHWAKRSKKIAVNPLAGMKKPTPRARGAAAALTDEQFATLRAAASPAAFQTFLDGMWHTGGRPGEIARLTAADVDLVSGVATLHQHKTVKKTGKPRLIFLSAEAAKMLKELVIARPTGTLFRNSHGRPWNRNALCSAIGRARVIAGIPKAVCYGLRHSYATAALVKGVPDATVAALLGHSGTAMLHKHYSHLTSRAQVMRAAAAQVRT